MKWDDVEYYISTKKVYFDGNKLINVTNDTKDIDPLLFKNKPINRYNRGIIGNIMLIINPPELNKHSKSL